MSAQLGFIIWMIFMVLVFFSLPKKDYPSPIIMFVMWASVNRLMLVISYLKR